MFSKCISNEKIINPYPRFLWEQSLFSQILELTQLIFGGSEAWVKRHLTYNYKLVKINLRVDTCLFLLAPTNILYLENSWHWPAVAYGGDRNSRVRNGAQVAPPPHESERIVYLMSS